MKALIIEHHRYSSPFRVGSHHVADTLTGRGAEVVWISHPRSPLHRLIGPLPPAVERHPAAGVLELTPRVLAPYVGLPGLGAAGWGRRWLSVGSSTRRLLARHDAVRCDLLWLSDFTMLSLLDLVEARRVVWRFFDRLDHFPRFPRSAFELVDRYLDRADLVVASSRLLQDDLAERGIEAIYLPNAAPAVSDETPRPAEVKPRVVYIGALDTWFDLAAVELWAAALPDVLFELGGPNPRRLRSELPNVVFRGPIDPGDVPRFVGGARFGIIPFERNDLTLGVHPIKLYDYLGAGCPVLSVDLPEVRPAPEGVFTYHTPEEGLDVLRRHLDTPFDRAALREMAIDNRWPARLGPVLDGLGLSFD